MAVKKQNILSTC